MAARSPRTWIVAGQRRETQPQAKTRRNNNKIKTNKTMIMLVSFLVGTVIGMTYMAMAIAQNRRRNTHERTAYGWLARDRDGELWLHDTEPMKDLESGTWISIKARKVYPERFYGVKWTDDKARRSYLVIYTEGRREDE